MKSLHLRTKAARVSSASVHPRRIWRSLSFMVACAAASCAGGFSARAQTFQHLTHDLNYSLESLMDHIMPPGVTDLRLGAGVAVVPKYEGDTNTRIIAVPVISARYKDIVSIDGSQARFNLLNLHQSPGSHPLSAGPMIKLDF